MYFINFEECVFNFEWVGLYQVDVFIKIKASQWLITYEWLLILNKNSIWTWSISLLIDGTWITWKQYVFAPVW